MVFVRNTDPEEDLAALQAVEPAMLRLGLLPAGLCVDVLHGDVFDASVGCGDSFAELRTSRLTGTGATDLCLVATLSFYRDAIWALAPGMCLLPAAHEAELLAVARAHCESEGVTLSPDARRLSVLAQHTLYAIAEQAKWDSVNGPQFVRALRRLIAHGRLCAMLDPRNVVP